jgi:molybdate-binding protein
VAGAVLAVSRGVWCRAKDADAAGSEFGPAEQAGGVGAGGLLPDGGEVIGFCSWREGLLLRPELADQTSGIKDVAGSGLRLVNREPGAEARSLLDRTLVDAGMNGSQLRGYHTRAAGHLDVAVGIAAGLADAGIASEPAALAYDLGFIPLATERFDLVIPVAQVSSREGAMSLRPGGRQNVRGP